jgi:hypothetical protein
LQHALEKGRISSLRTLIRRKAARTRVASWSGQRHGTAGATTEPIEPMQIVAKRLPTSG